MFCVSLRCTMCYFDTFIHCNMPTLKIIVQYCLYLLYCTLDHYAHCKFVPSNNIIFYPLTSFPGNHRFTLFFKFHFFF